ncbi:MAG: peptidoglycan DD-metalloendopeptidase family protein [Ginsengibacter sp.]
MRKLVFTATVLLFSMQFSLAQTGSNKDDLQKQRQQLKREIEETERVLNETRSTTKVNIGQLNTINKRIDLQDNVIENITGQLKYIENDIFKSQKEVYKLAKVLDTLKQEYAKSMVYSYMNRNNYDFLNFIFSASSFNDAIKRVTYLKSYRNYREMQGINISRTQDLLKQRINELSGNKLKKNMVLQEKSHEMTELEKQQQMKEQIVSKLKGRQKELTSQISVKRKQDSKLKGMITAMIRREIENARKKAEEDRRERDRLAALNKPKTNIPDITTKPRPVTREPKNTGSVLVTSEADKVLDANFERNKGSLPWPVDGFIINHFGANQLPGGIDYNNPGVSIGTKPGAGVKSVFDGEVTLVSYMDDKQVVFIKHGKYFTVYSNLSSADVQRGQSVKTGQVIGKSGANDDGQGQVDLIIMKENNNVNPEQWLRRK